MPSAVKESTKSMKNIFNIIAAMMLLIACDNRVEVAVDIDAPIYPDYANVTIPVNIAPLNFLVRNDLAKDVRVFVEGELMAESSGNEVTFNKKEWREMLQRHCGKTVR